MLTVVLSLGIGLKELMATVFLGVVIATILAERDELKIWALDVSVGKGVGDRLGVGVNFGVADGVGDTDSKPDNPVDDLGSGKAETTAFKLPVETPVVMEPEISDAEAEKTEKPANKNIIVAVNLFITACWLKWHNLLNTSRRPNRPEFLPQPLFGSVGRTL